LFDVQCPALGASWAEAFTARHKDWTFYINVRNECDIVLSPISTQMVRNHDQFIIENLRIHARQIVEIRQACSRATLRFAVFRELERSFVISIALGSVTLSELAQTGMPFEISVYPNSRDSDEI
jgi:hypothetical protein